MKKKKSRLFIGVMGCMAERTKEDLTDNHHVDVVCGPDAYLSLPDLMAQVDVIIGNFTVVYGCTEILVCGVGSAVFESVLTCQDTVT